MFVFPATLASNRHGSSTSEVHIYVFEPTKQVLVLNFNPNRRATEKNAVSIWLIRKNIWSKKDFEESAQGQISSFLAPLRFSCSGLNHLSPTNYLIRQRKCLIHWGHFIIRREHYRITRDQANMELSLRMRGIWANLKSPNHFNLTHK